MSLEIETDVDGPCARDINTIEFYCQDESLGEFTLQIRDTMGFSFHSKKEGIVEGKLDAAAVEKLVAILRASVS